MMPLVACADLIAKLFVPDRRKQSVPKFEVQIEGTPQTYIPDCGRDHGDSFVIALCCVGAKGDTACIFGVCHYQWQPSGGWHGGGRTCGRPPDSGQVGFGRQLSGALG
jgi:hypothetical protein